jgi:hypothetical protein
MNRRFGRDDCQAVASFRNLHLSRSFRDGDWGDADVIARLQQLFQTLTSAEVAQSILIVDRHRVRRRRLPIHK